MSLPLSQIARIGAYTLSQHIKGGRYPLVASALMSITTAKVA